LRNFQKQQQKKQQKKKKQRHTGGTPVLLMGETPMLRKSGYATKQRQHEFTN